MDHFKRIAPLALLMFVACGDGNVSVSTDAGVDEADVDQMGDTDTSQVDTADDTSTTPDTVEDDTATPDTSTPDVTPDTAPDTTPDTLMDTDEPDVPEPITCDREGFDPYWALGINDGSRRTYRGSTLGRIHDEVVITLDTAGTPAGPGTYAVNSGAGCDVCTTIRTDCVGYGGSCGRTYQAIQGEIDVTAVGDRVTATLRDVALEADDGHVWCLDGYSVDVATWAPPSGNTPAQVGQQITDFNLQNCGTGETVPFASAMDAKGVWAVTTAGWCPYCSQWVPQVIAREAALDAEGIATAYLISADQNYNPATLEYCRAYAANYGGDPNRFYIDVDHSTTFRHMTPNVAMSTPMNLMVRNRDRRFVFSAGFYDTSVDVGLAEMRR